MTIREEYLKACEDLGLVKAFLDGIRLGDPSNDAAIVCWERVNTAQHVLNGAACSAVAKPPGVFAPDEVAKAIASLRTGEFSHEYLIDLLKRLGGE